MQDWLAHRARVTPHKAALIYGDQHWSYRELNREAADLAGRLAAAGVTAEQHVAVLMSNRAEYLFLIHALARLRAVLVPLNTRLTPEELAWQLRQSDSNYLICSAETEAQAAAVANEVNGVMSVDTARSPGVDSLAEFEFASPPPQSSPGRIDGGLSLPKLNLDTLQGIIYTSGTTGRPKGTMLTFGNHYWSATASAFRLGVDPADRWLLCMPLYHVGGLAIVLRCCLYGTTVVLQNGFNTVAVCYALDYQDVTLLSVVPTMLHWLLDAHKNTLANSKLRTVLVGGAAATKNLVDACLNLRLPVATTYGLTEAASQLVTAPPGDVVRKPGSVGKPLLFTEVRIVGQEGQSVEPGQVGEIVARGPTIMRGYYKQPAATQKALQNGELHTGDVGYLDDDGDLWIVQRRTDLIVSGGENVYPAEIEQVLTMHPAVADVCVVGLENDEWGQQVAAAVVLKPEARSTSSEELLEFSRERLAGYKQPRRINFVETLPRTMSGKVKRDDIRRSIENG